MLSLLPRSGADPLALPAEPALYVLGLCEVAIAGAPGVAAAGNGQDKASELSVCFACHDLG